MIRDATVLDAQQICDIYNVHVEKTIVTFEFESVSAATMAERIESTQRNYPWLVSVNDGKVDAYAYASSWRTRAAYNRTAETAVYVCESAQGAGRGTEIYQALLDRLRSDESGFHCALGGIALPNDASVRLHEKLGFKKVAEFPEVGRKFDQWIDVGFWQITF